jgi:hypothetical protein
MRFFCLRRTACGCWRTCLRIAVYLYN